MINELDKKRFNSRIFGKVIVSADIRCSPFCTESAAEVYITDPRLYERISEYSLLHGEDLQGLFWTVNYEYMSFFIRDVEAFCAEFSGEDSLQALFKHGKGETIEFLISFPETECKSPEEITDTCF